METVQAVLEASPDAVLVVDGEGVVHRANRNVEAVLGYPPEEVEGTTVEDLLLQADREAHVGHRNAYMADPDPRPMGTDLDLHARHKDGSAVPVEISLGPIEIDGNPYVVATVVDITRRKERERELERQNDRLDGIASIVSHDLRNPLNVANGRLALARDECDSENLDKVADAHARMTTMIEDLLTLAREGKTIESMEPVDLQAIARGCWSAVSDDETSFNAVTDRTILADDRRLKQLLENLFRNAIEHGGKGVTVTLGDHNEGFFVEDDGVGIPESEREAVFENAYSLAGGSTGLGLAIVEEIVEAHSWTIKLGESAAGGARFDVTGVEFE